MHASPRERKETQRRRRGREGNFRLFLHFWPIRLHYAAALWATCSLLQSEREERCVDYKLDSWVVTPNSFGSNTDLYLWIRLGVLEAECGDSRDPNWNSHSRRHLLPAAYFICWQTDYIIMCEYLNFASWPCLGSLQCISMGVIQSVGICWFSKSPSEQIRATSREKTFSSLPSFILSLLRHTFFRRVAF